VGPPHGAGAARPAPIRCKPAGPGRSPELEGSARPGCTRRSARTALRVALHRLRCQPSADMLNGVSVSRFGPTDGGIEAELVLNAAL